MIAFIVPLKSKAISNNWKTVSQLCIQTINSLLNQQHKLYKVFLVCNELPIGFLSSDKVEVIVKDYPIPAFGNHAQYNYNKLNKQRDAIIAAVSAGCTHYMEVDADDRVSNNLIKCIQNYSHADGWYLDSGWIRHGDSPFIHIQKNDFHRICGSSVIAPLDLKILPDLNGDIEKLRPFLEHNRIVDTWINNGKKMQPICYPAALYLVNTGDNISSINRTRTLKSYLKNAISSRILTDNIAREFLIDKKTKISN